MADLEVIGIEKLRRKVSRDNRRHIPFAVALSLNDVAQSAKKRTVAEMRRVFRRPTRYTLNSLRVERANIKLKKELQSKVLFKDPDRIVEVEHYLTPQAFGGGRLLKPFEYRLKRRGVLPDGYLTVPGEGADMDANGNMKRGQIVQILSYFQSFSESGFKSNTTAKGKARLAKGTVKKYGIGYFSVQPGNKSKKQPGIYKRIHSNFGTGIRPVLIFVKSVQYKKILNLQKITDKTYDDSFQTSFNRNLNRALRTAR